MASNDRLEKLRHFIEVVQVSGDYDAWGDYLHEDLVLPPDMPEGYQGLEGFKKAVQIYETWMTLDITVEEMVVSGDKVAIRNTIRGTQLSPEFYGLADSVGKSFEFTEMLIAELRGDKVIRFDRVADRYTLVRQLKGEA